VPRLSHGRRMLRSDGGPNKLFFCYLFTDHAMAIEFFKDIGLLRRTMQCESCGQDMTWSVRSKLSDDYHDFLRCIVNIFRLEIGPSFFFNTTYHDFLCCIVNISRLGIGVSFFLIPRTTIFCVVL